MSLQAHESYTRTSRASAQRLATIWQDLETAPADQRRELQDCSAKALSAWTDAVDEAESKRVTLRKRIEEALCESQRIKEQLGDASAEEASSSGTAAVRCQPQGRLHGL